MTIIGKKAPIFSAPAVINGNEIVQDFSLQHYLGKQAVVLFFYPKDFTFVCPTELLALQAKSQAFEKRKVAIVGCSTDTEETHWAWLHVSPNQGGIQGVTYPLIADTSKTISANYGVLGGNWYVDENDQMQFDGVPVAHRGVFLIDEAGIIRHMLINDLPLGRNIDEILRTIDMMQHVENHGEVCPVNWQSGAKAFKPTAEDLVAYLNQMNTSESTSSDTQDKGCNPQSCDPQEQCSPPCCKTPEETYEENQEDPLDKTLCNQCNFYAKDCNCGEPCASDAKCMECKRNKENCCCINRNTAHIQCFQCGCKKGRCRCETTQTI